jgi:phospholipid-transporting ATPase
MIAEREITPDEYKAFAKHYYSALTSTTNKKEKLDSCYESLEKELVLIGATAIEDCLQDDLSKFRKIIKINFKQHNIGNFIFREYLGIF